MGSKDINRDGILNPKTFLLHAGFVLGILGVVIPFFVPSFHPFGIDNNNANNNNELVNLKIDLNDKLTAINVRLDSIDTKLFLIQNAITDLKIKRAGGNLSVAGMRNKTSAIYNISIASPLNNSIIPSTQRFIVNGTTNLAYDLCENGLYKIYVVSKLGDKYWIQTEAYPDENGNWQGYRPCLIPNKFNNNSTIYAIISKNEYLLARSSDEIPEHISISEPITVRIRNSNE